MFRDTVLRDGTVPTPFELAPYQLTPSSVAPCGELSHLTARLKSAIAERKSLGGELDAGLEGAEALALVAQYALGEVPFGAVHPSDTESRFQFGDVLFRERQFDRAIDAWRPILEDRRVIGRLAELQALRRQAPPGLNVWDFGVEQVLHPDPPIEALASARVEDLFRRAKVGSPFEAPRDVVRRGIPEDEPIQEATDEPAIFFPEGKERADAVPSETWTPTNSESLFVLTEHAQFRLEATMAGPFASVAAPRFTLHSAYRGAIRARLDRVSDKAAFDRLDETTLVAMRPQLAPVQEWETELAPISENSMQVGVWPLEVPRQPAGYFVLIADARYCPVFAVARFVVTNIALVQQLASDRVLLFAVDRSTGTPIAGVPLAGRVVGRFGAATADAATAHADVEASFHGKTGADGLFEWTVSPPWQPGYQYAVRTDSPEACCSVESPYLLPGSKALRALVYSDRPLYRPGDSVSFKGLLRVLDGEGLHPYDGHDAVFEFATAKRVLCTRRCETTDLGTACGSFQLPAECELGRCTVRVNGGPAQGLLEVEEYRKPEFEIVFDHPQQVRGGDSVDVGIRVRYFTGEAVPDVPVTVTLDAGGPNAAPIDWLAAPAQAGRRAWRQLESRTLTTDAAGRCRYRFTTDEGVAANYVVTARACEASRREVAMSTSIQATGALPQGERATAPRPETRSALTVSLDREAYREGDTACVSIRGGGASHVLVTTATGRIHSRTVVALVAGAAQVPLPLGQDDVPNVEVVALAVRDDGLETGRASVLVSPVDRFLTVEVSTDRAEYRPGQECQATVRVTDSKGRPVPDCELSLGVVNEAIYSIQEDTTPDLREFFHRYVRPLSVWATLCTGGGTRAFIVWKAPTFVKGMINTIEIEGAGGGGGGRYGGRYGGMETLIKHGGGLALPPPRSEFRDTAYWNARLTTGSDGTATVSFTLPDDLTRLRFTARGITRDHKVGAVKQGVVVRMPFHVRLATPRVVQEGNSLAISGLIHNDTGERQTVRCSLEGPFPVRGSTAPAALTIESGEVAQVQYLVSIDRFLPEAKFTFGAACDDGPSDATNEGMTAYVLYGLALCRKAGVDVDPGVADRGAALLRSRLEATLSASEPPAWRRAPLPVSVDPRVYALLALAEHDSADERTVRMARSLLKRIAEPTPAEGVMLSLAFERTVRGDPARESAWAISLLREVVRNRRFSAKARGEAVQAAPPIAVASEEHRDDRTLFFLTTLPAGTSHLYYTARAELPGTLRVLPPRAEPMYEPEVWGSGQPSALHVTDDVLVASSARTLGAPPGVDGLLQVVDILDRVDADEVIRLIPSHPRIGDLLAQIVGEAGVRAWLSVDVATCAAGADLGARIRAARQDLATRRLCADAPWERLSVIEEALANGDLARRVFEGASVGDVDAIDSALLWVQEDRAYRLALLAQAQRLRATTRLEVDSLRSVTVADVLRALGPRVPSGDALVRWKLSQRGEFPAGTLGELTSRLEADLGLKILAARDLGHDAAEGRVSEVLDAVLGPEGLFYRVRDGVVRIGPLEDLVK